MHSWCKKCKQYEGTESKNVPSQRKVFPGGSLAHVAPESGFPRPQSQEHGGPAVTTGRPLRGLCLQQTSGALLPLTGSAGGPGPSALPVAPALDPEAPLSSSLTYAVISPGHPGGTGAEVWGGPERRPWEQTVAGDVSSSAAHGVPRS